MIANALQIFTKADATQASFFKGTRADFPQASRQGNIRQRTQAAKCSLRNGFHTLRHQIVSQRAQCRQQVSAVCGKYAGALRTQVDVLWVNAHIPDGPVASAASLKIIFAPIKGSRVNACQSLANMQGFQRRVLEGVVFQLANGIGDINFL